MGIGPEPADMLRGLRHLLPERFNVCDLGDQMWHSGRRRDPKFWSRPAHDLYEDIGGVGFYASLDGNGGGTHMVDLNKPLGVQNGARRLLGQFDLVTDFGTTEHVFDFCQAWRTIHELGKPGSLIAFEKPYQGYPEHGFYNVHQTLILDLAHANGYEIGHLTKVEAPRGEHWRGFFVKPKEWRPFALPFQGKYRKKLKI